MTPSLEQEVLAELQRVDDQHAAAMVNDEVLRELRQAIMATAAGDSSDSSASRARWRATRRPMLGLAGAAAVTGAVVAITGVTGDGPTGPPVADAAVLRGAYAALAHPGVILIESYTGLSRINPKYGSYAPGTRPKHIEIYRFSAHEITETPAGAGPQNELNLGGPGVTGGREIGEVNGTDELYVPADDTVYLTSQYGHSITPGPRPGTFTYTEPKIARAPAGSAAAQSNAHMPPPLTITATQARALRDGTAAIQSIPDDRAMTSWHLKLAPAFREAIQDSDPTAAIRHQLATGKLHVAGRTTVDGHAAIRLTAAHGLTEDDVAPRTYVPLRTISGSHGDSSIIIYRQYRTLPITPANERLLSLTARHPGANVVHNDRAYLASQG